MQHLMKIYIWGWHTLCLDCVTAMASAPCLELVAAEHLTSLLLVVVVDPSDLHETECLGKRYNDSFCIVQKYRISFQKSCILCTLSQKKSSNSAHHWVMTANKHVSFWNQCSLTQCALVPKSSDQMLTRALFCVIWQKNSFLLAYLFEQYMYVFQKSLICWQVPMCIGFLFYSLGYVC